MGNSKVQLANGTVLMDLTGDTVTAATLAEGVTAHDASGEPITGVAPTDAVRYSAQALTETQQGQARTNIGAASENHTHDYEASGAAATALTNAKTYTNTMLNRTTAVNAADANYGTIMGRGIGLSSTETTPTVNGAIIFQYE